MPLPVHESRLPLRVGAPQDKDNRPRLVIHQPDHRIGEALPALALMRGRKPRLHRENRIEQQHPLLRPGFKISMGRRLKAKIALHFLVDIDQ